MKFSPLKRDIVLLIVRDYEVVEVNGVIQAQLNVGIEQIFYIIDHLINQQLLNFNDGELHLTNAAYNILKERKLDTFSFNEIEKHEFFINENFLSNYIPKKI